MPQNKLWTVASCLSWTRDYLDRKGDEHARLSAEWLLCAATDKDRTRLYMDYDQPLSADELSLMHGYIERRAAGEPLQYITGRTTFRFVEVACEPGVLIPRPETEILVDAALEGVDACSDDEPLVLEVGTGTGCVAASIASERKAGRVVVTDLYPVAAVDESLMGRFAVLVSNPPYIPTAVLEAEVPAEVRDNEPDLALDGGADGLDVYRRLLELAPRALRPGGMLCVELFEGALDPAALLAREQGVWETVEVREDLTHRPRILVARLPRE